MIDEITTRNCQIVTIPTKTHNIILASKKDIPNAERTVKEFLSDFEIINVIPKVRSGELIKPMVATSIDIHKDNKAHTRHSSLALYLQIKDLLPDTFTAAQYHAQIKNLVNVKLASVYAHVDSLIKAGKIKELDGHTLRTFQKVHMTQEEPDTKLKEIMGGSAPGRFI